MTPGDLVTIPREGDRIGRVLARVDRVQVAQVRVRIWHASDRKWGFCRRVVMKADCLPAPESDRRVKQVRKMEAGR